MRRFIQRSAMIRTLFLSMVVGALMAAGAHADDFQIPLDSDGLPAWSIKMWTDVPVRLVLPDQEALQTLLDKVPIADFDRSQIRPEFAGDKPVRLVLETRVTDGELAALEQAGYQPERLRDVERENREASEQLWRLMVEGKAEGLRSYPLNYVPTNEQTGSMLQGIAADHPTMASYYTWGTSVQGRTLHALVISQDVHTSAAKPQVRYSSTMHGDEITGLVLCINLAYYLTDKYGLPGYEDVTDLVDNYELHLMPNHNPDGTALGRRNNANGVDLNRNFPEPAGTHAIRQLENQHFIAHAHAHHFVISLNYHGGALVMNYPWDYTYTLTPDNDAIIKLCLEYSTRNLPMYNGNWPQGITNGAQWYVITGSLQDWSYDQTDCIDVTCEVSNTKWPSGSALPGFWDHNRDAMVAYARSARSGITGQVTDAVTGDPLAAVINVVGNAKPVHTNPAHGDYYKLLDNGTFTVTASAPGYITQTAVDVVNTWGVQNIVDFALQPEATSEVLGTVANLQGEGLDALVEIRTWPLGDLVEAINTYASEGGAFATDLLYGDYTVTASAPERFPATQQIVVGVEPVEVNFALGGMVVQYPVDEDFEGGPGVFEGDWVVVSPGFDSDHCMKSSVGNYPNNATLLATMSEGFSLVDVADPELTFYAKWSIESSWDAVFFEISTNNGSQWTPLAVPGRTRSASGQGRQTPSGTPCFDGDQASWILCSVDLSPYLGQPDVRFRFRLVSDGSVTRDGFYLDDFKVTVIGQEDTTSTPEVVPMAVASVKAYPNPFNPGTNIRLVNPRSGAVAVAVYDVQGRLVRTLLRADLIKGEHHVPWDGLTDAGRPAGSGVYFVRLLAGDQQAHTKISLVK